VDPHSALFGRGVTAELAADAVGSNGEKWNLLR
jgi:hypothetical protein